MKAYLSSRHPALVVEGGNFDSLLHATGLGDNALAAYPKLMINGVWLAPQAIEYALNSAT